MCVLSISGACLFNQISKTYSQSICLALPCAGGRYFFAVAQKSIQKKLVQKKAIASTGRYSKSLSGSFTSRIVMLVLTGSLSLMLLLLPWVVFAWAYVQYVAIDAIPIFLSLSLVFERVQTRIRVLI